MHYSVIATTNSSDLSMLSTRVRAAAWEKRDTNGRFEIAQHNSTSLRLKFAVEFRQLDNRVGTELQHALEVQQDPATVDQQSSQVREIRAKIID